jgi:hypothetical protein
MQAHGRVGRTDNGLIQRAIAGMGRMVAPDGSKGRRQSRQRSRYPDGRWSPSDGESRWCDEGPRHPDAWSRRHDGSTRPSGPNVPGMQVHGRAGATNDAAIRRDGTVIRMHGWGSRFDGPRSPARRRSWSLEEPRSSTADVAKHREARSFLGRLERATRAVALQRPHGFGVFSEPRDEHHRERGKGGVEPEDAGEPVGARGWDCGRLTNLERETGL